MEKFIGMMVDHTKVISKIINSMDKEFIVIEMGKFIQDHFKMERNMEKEKSIFPIKVFTKEFGKTIRKSELQLSKVMSVIYRL